MSGANECSGLQGVSENLTQSNKTRKRYAGMIAKRVSEPSRDPSETILSSSNEEGLLNHTKTKVSIENLTASVRSFVESVCLARPGNLRFFIAWPTEKKVQQSKRRAGIVPCGLFFF